MTKLTSISIADIDPNLAADLDSPASEFTAWTALYNPDAEFDTGNRYHIVHHAGAQRGGIVMVGSGSSGRTEWTDAATPDEVLERELADNMAH